MISILAIIHMSMGHKEQINKSTCKQKTMILRVRLMLSAALTHIFGLLLERRLLILVVEEATFYGLSRPNVRMFLGLSCNRIMLMP